MARSHARIHVSIWHNDDFRALSAESQRVYFLILSQPTLTWAGVAPYTPKRWARLAANTTATRVVKAVGELASRRFLVVDEETEEVWVRTFVRWDGVLTQPNVMKAMLADLGAIASHTIREAFLEEYPDVHPNPFGNPSPNPSPNPSGNPSVGSQGKGNNGTRLAFSPTPSPSLSPSSAPSTRAVANGSEREPIHIADALRSTL